MVGDTFEFTVSSLDNVTNEYVLTEANGNDIADVETTWNEDNNTVTIKGAIKGTDMDLVLTKKVRATVAINVGTVAVDATLEFVTNDSLTGNPLDETGGGDVYKGTPVEFTVALSADTGIEAVTYTVGPDDVHDITNDGVWDTENKVWKFTIPGADVQVMDVTIDVTTTSTAPATITFKGTPTEKVYYTDKENPTGADWKIFAEGVELEVAHDFDGTIKIKSEAPVTVTSSDGAKATVSDPTDYLNYTISNVSGDVDITVADTMAATGLDATAGTDGKIAFSGASAGLMVYLTTGTTTPTMTGVKVGMTVAEVEEVLSDATNETVNFDDVEDAANYSLTSAANTHYLVIVAVNESGRVVKAGASEITGIT